jgi:hypothetical protein
MEPGQEFHSHTDIICYCPACYTAPADDHKTTTREFKLIAHGTTEIDVVYTNDPAKVESVLKQYEQWLEMDEPTFKMKFVGLDIEYTRGPEVTREAQQVAIIQSAMRNHILVFHFCRYVQLQKSHVNSLVNLS